MGTNEELIERLRSVAGFDHLPRTDLAVLAADALEAADARIAELEAEAKEYRIGRIHRIGELQELAEAEARIAELEGGEWEYSWEGETEDGSWVLAKVFSCVEDAQAFAESTSGAWVKRDGGRMVKQHLGPWVPVESEVE